MAFAVDRSDLGLYAVGQAAVDYEQRIDWHSLRRRRVDRARDQMERAGLDGLLVWKDENVRFLSGLRPQIIQGKSALLNGCLLRLDGRMTLFLSGGEVDRVGLTMPWVEDIRPVPIMEAQGLIAGAYDAAIAPAVRALELDAARIGIDEIAFAQLAEVSRTLPAVRLCDGDAVLQAARMRKDPAELAAMQEASAIAEALTEAAIRAVAPGVREYEVVAAAMSELYRLGGEMAHLATPFVASGERMSPPQRFASDKLIREGDLVFIDIGAMWNGYFSDIGRVVVCGKPSRRQREIYTAVYHSLDAARDAMRPGNTNLDVARAALAAGEERGFGDRFLSLFIGHGVGMGANEPPYVGERLPGAATVTLEAGMTLAIEPLIWVPDVRGGGGVRLEDTIAVADGGGRSLTRTAFDESLLLDD
jgi:Xaa-Pro aminopeptidase